MGKEGSSAFIGFIRRGCTTGETGLAGAAGVIVRRTVTGSYCAPMGVGIFAINGGVGKGGVAGAVTCDGDGRFGASPVSVSNSYSFVLTGKFVLGIRMMPANGMV
ncbi:MAG: hypothetical protein AAAB35_19870 [Phyllobacterium sp.]|uniref:hypothetical protein n=1 Tax=Phyllobacterium sp. TaxID=1871046 RepID=UPI0030F1D3D6